VKSRARSFKNSIIERNPQTLNSVEAVFTWLIIILISIPWLSYILFLSFVRKEWNRKIPLVNAWAQFILKKILRINLVIEDRHDYPSPPYVFILLNQSSLLESLLVVPAVLPETMEVFPFVNVEFLLVPFLGNVTCVLHVTEYGLFTPPRMGFLEDYPF